MKRIKGITILALALTIVIASLFLYVTPNNNCVIESSIHSIKNGGWDGFKLSARVDYDRQFDDGYKKLKKILAMYFTK